jgi:hypothetical protein
MRAMTVSGKNSGDMEGFESFGTGSVLGCIFQSLSVHDGLEIKQGAIENFVDYNEVEFFDLSQLNGRILQAQLDGFGAVFTAALQTAAQLFPAGGEDEDQNGIANSTKASPATMASNSCSETKKYSRPCFS